MKIGDKIKFSHAQLEYVGYIYFINNSYDMIYVSQNRENIGLAQSWVIGWDDVIQGASRRSESLFEFYMNIYKIYGC